MLIRDAQPDDMQAVLDIYNKAVRELAAIWTDHEDDLAERTAWLTDMKAHNWPVFIAEADDGRIMGYGYFSSYRGRDGYALTVEHSVYLTEWAQGQGAGRAMLEKLIKTAKQSGYHAMIGVIEAENTISIALHKKLGFADGGVLPQLGQKFGRWLDQHQMVLLLDDRPNPPPT